MNRCVLIGIAFLLPLPLFAAEPKSPATVTDLYADFDPRKDPLDVKLVREWEKDGIVYRTVTFHVGTFRGTPARMAAFYAFPKGAKRVAALLHLHGGGQRAFLHEVEFYARRGYACLSLNWGGREMEGATDGDPNTDWGAVDPTQNNVPGYFSLRPGDKAIDPFDSPRNNNWYVLTLGARRGLTFLEQQPEVDPDKLGVYGHSMGGSLTVYVAGSDRRVRAAAPSVGGSGFRTQPWPLLPQVTLETPTGDVKVFEATLGFESYAPHIAAPLLWLGSTNDFHGIMDDTHRTGALIPHDNVRYAFTPHMNHRFTPEFAVTRPLWFDQHLEGNFAFPQTPQTHLSFATMDHVPLLEVRPDSPRDVTEVIVHYSIDPDPRARFWRSADVAQVDDTRWTAPLPILSVDQPLFAFANVVYKVQKTESEPHARPTQRFALSSRLHAAAPAEIAAGGVRVTDEADPLIDGFAHGWRDWYTLSADNPHHWEFSTRKLADPKWQGHDGQRLSVEVRAEQPNDLVIVLTENVFRPYRGKQTEFVAVVKLAGGQATQTVALEPKNFLASDGTALSAWKDVDLLSFRAYHERGETLLGSKTWDGPQPVFTKLWWQAEGVPRPTPSGLP
jgi:dienelactone hydrolase